MFNLLFPGCLSSMNVVSFQFCTVKYCAVLSVSHYSITVADTLCKNLDLAVPDALQKGEPDRIPSCK